jgi:hypothetical protein
VDSFAEMIGSRGQIQPDESVLADGVAFAGSRSTPARVKCALLSWMAFKEATVRRSRHKESSMSEDTLPQGGTIAARRGRRRGHARRRRPRTGHQRRRPRPRVRHPRRRGERRHPGHDAHVGACPLTDVIEDQTRPRSVRVPGGGLVSDFRINWVWLPPWGPTRSPTRAASNLRSLGFNV